MTKYRIKQKLKKMDESGENLSVLTRFLISEGYSYDDAKEGLEPFVSWWEESVEYIEQASVNDVGYNEEYDHDLWARTMLFNVLEHASKDELKKFENRISMADQRFINATDQTHMAINHIDNPDMDIHWWLFRRIKK